MHHGNEFKEKVYIKHIIIIKRYEDGCNFETSFNH